MGPKHLHSTNPDTLWYLGWSILDYTVWLNVFWGGGYIPRSCLYSPKSDQTQHIPEYLKGLFQLLSFCLLSLDLLSFWLLNFWAKFSFGLLLWVFHFTCFTLMFCFKLYSLIMVFSFKNSLWRFVSISTIMRFFLPFVLHALRGVTALSKRLSRFLFCAPHIIHVLC